MSSEINLDKYVRKCITVITICILLVFCAFASRFTFVTLFEKEGPSAREIHMKQHKEEGARLDRMILVLESINSKLESDDE